MTGKPKSYRLKIPRIIKIDREIRSGVYPNTTSLAREYEVDARTIKRDIDYMKDSLDAPIDYNRSRRGYYYTEPNFFLPALDISESDFFALCVSEKALRQYENTPLYEKLSAVFDKLRAFLPDDIRVNTSWVDTHYTFRTESFTYIQPEIWETLSQGLRLNRQVRISHRKAGCEEHTERTVEPYHIINYGGEWYLVAYCHERKEVVHFAISRISEARLLDAAYRIDSSFDLDEFLGSSFGIMIEDTEHMVTIRFSKEQAPYVLERRWHASQSVKENTDGTVDLSFTASSLFEVKRWVLSWGADARVLGPPELVRDITDEIHNMKTIYSLM